VFYQVLRSERQVAVLENSLKVQDERVRDMRGRQDAGVARPLDVAQTQAQASATRVTLIAARNDAINGRSLLSLLTGVPLHNAVLLDAYDIPVGITGMTEYLNAAGRLRRDLAAADSAVEAARKNVDVAVGQYYPSVTLDLTAFLYRETLPTERDWQGVLRA